MDSKSQDSQNPDSETPSKTQSQLPIIPFTSITLSIPKSIPTYFISPPTISPNLPKIPATLKIPTQIASIFNLSLSSTAIPVTKSALKSTVSANPLSNPLSLNPRRPSDPSNAAGLRRVSVVWFRNDLRLHDNESLTSANNESISVLPVYCFDPKDFGNSSSGFDKTGPNRASFLIESVSDLRKNLQAKGSDLIVRIGKPETVLAELVNEIGAEAVYMHKEVSNDEIKGEQKIENALKDEDIEIKYFWGSTLYHIEDLPFKLEEMPTNYGGFRDKVKGIKVRNTIEVLDQLKGLPSGGNVDPGEIPSLADLGLNPTPNMTQVKPVINGSLIGGETEALNQLKKLATEFQNQPPKENKVKTVINGPLIGGENKALNRLKKFATEFQNQPPKENKVKPVINGPLIGGENEALNRLKKFATEWQTQPPKENKNGNNDSIYGANFSSKISPWLSTGCISPRVVFDELKKSSSRTISAGSNGNDGGDSGLNWLMYELLWRDFFRFVTRKYSSSKQHNKSAVTA